MVRSLRLIAILGSLPCQGLAQDLLQGIDPDVRAGVLFEGIRTDRRISLAIPPELSDFNVPENLQFVGSSIDDLRWVAVYKTNLAADSAKQLTAEALMETGWQSFRPWSSGGFVNVHMPDPVVCRDDLLINVNTRSLASVTYILLQSAGENTNCSGEIPPPRLPEFLLQPAIKYLPQLVLPGGAKPVAKDPVETVGSATTIDARIRTRLFLDPDLGAAYLADEYSNQLEEQLWTIQGRWSADRSAGSSWLAIRDSSVLLSGLLQIVSLGGSEYELVFHLDYVP